MTAEVYEKKLAEFQKKMREIAEQDLRIARDYALAAISDKPADKEKNEQDARRWLLKYTQTGENLKLFETIMRSS